MTEHNLKHNYINNISHIFLAFLVSWELVGYIRIHILDIPYTIWNNHSYDFIASFALVAILYYFLYKKKPLKVDLPILFIGVFISSLNVVFIHQLIFNLIAHNISRDLAQEVSPYMYILMIGPMASYILGFVSKKAFLIYLAINIIGFFAYSFV